MKRVFCLVFLLRYSTSVPVDRLILQCQTKENDLISISGSIQHDVSSELMFSIDGDLVDETMLNISSILCLKKSCPTCYLCSKEFQSKFSRFLTSVFFSQYDVCFLGKHLFLNGLMKSNSVFVIDDHLNEWMSSFIEHFRRESMICAFDRSIVSSKSDPKGVSLKKSSIFGIIFFSLCIVLTLAFSCGWILFIYVQRLKLERTDRKIRQAISKTVKEFLDESPIILFNCEKKYSDPIPDDPICSICLSPFVNGEPIRKLSKSKSSSQMFIIVFLHLCVCVCSLDCLHYFHVPCIDPWLLENGRCPLCNDHIAPIALRTVSAFIDVTSLIVP